jgi:hypothetical protein
MFNPEKMMGNLLNGGVRRKRGLGALLSGGAALGLVGGHGGRRPLPADRLQPRPPRSAPIWNRWRACWGWTPPR